MISVGIVGASGYTGEELARLLANHPNVELKSLTSKTHEGKEINTIFKPVSYTHLTLPTN